MPEASKNVRVLGIDHSALNSVKAEIMLKSGKPTNLQEAFHVVMEYYTRQKILDTEILKDVQNIEQE